MKRLLAVLMVLVGFTFAIAPATSWVSGAVGKYNGGSASSITTEGGNVSEVNVTQYASTEKWAGFWGSVDGGLYLAPDTSNIFYQWSWDPNNGATLCALTDNNFDWANVQAAAAGDVDSAWGFSTSDTDSATNTFTGTTTIRVAGLNVANAASADTGSSGGYVTAALKDTSSVGGKGDIAFCVAVVNDQTLFNGQTGDYELMVATDPVYGHTEVYNFWLELH